MIPMARYQQVESYRAMLFTLEAIILAWKCQLSMDWLSSMNFKASIAMHLSSDLHQISCSMQQQKHWPFHHSYHPTMSLWLQM